MATQTHPKFKHHSLPNTHKPRVNCGLSAEGGGNFQSGKENVEDGHCHHSDYSRRTRLPSRMILAFLCHNASFFPSRTHVQRCFPFAYSLILPHNLGRQPRQCPKVSSRPPSRPGMVSGSLFLPFHSPCGDGLAAVISSLHAGRASGPMFQKKHRSYQVGPGSLLGCIEKTTFKGRGST